MLKIPDSIKKVWFISDPHFGHKNVLIYDSRPFKDIIVHDNTIIDNYNSVVDDNDYVFFLGDFSLSGKQYTESILIRLKGIKFFIKGNHDKKPSIQLFKKYGTFLGEQKTVEIDKKHTIILNHFSMQSWDRSHRGTWHLFGHDHSGNVTPIGKSLNMAIHLNDYYPVEFETIKKKLSIN